jgi:hypothetical protein
MLSNIKVAAETGVLLALRLPRSRGGRADDANVGNAGDGGPDDAEVKVAMVRGSGLALQLRAR